jgi:hypothetical protein
LSSANPSPLGNQRRSQRVMLGVRILVSGQRESGAAFAEDTVTVIVNAHGAMIQLRESVRRAQMLNVRNAATGEELVCKVVDVSAGSIGVPEVGVEFTEPNPQFWRVSFPPADWNPRSPEAKRLSLPPSPAPRPAPLPVAKK